jgi:hypothetical protein
MDGAPFGPHGSGLQGAYKTVGDGIAILIYEPAA